MPSLLYCKPIACLLFSLGLSACSSYYQAYGYGWVQKSSLAVAEPIAVVLPEGAPSISQRFRPVNLPADAGHKGIDMLVPSATPVLAAADGEVARVELSILYGRQVMINHAETAAGYRIQTRYYHLSKQLVQPGERIARGELLGYAGASGLAGLYPHLHFEVHRLNEASPAIAINYLDPQLFWVDGVGMVTCFDRGRDYAQTGVALTYPVPCKFNPWQ